MFGVVLVTGASGYVASHVVKVLLEKGYRVRGTVRSFMNAERVNHLYDLCPDSKHKLELVEADLTKDDTWPRAVVGCEYVHHVASPLPLEEPKNEDDVIVPAVQGTLGVLKASAKTGTVRRVVLTSSCAAIANMGGNKEPMKEKDWTNLDDPGLSAYSKSKHLAEKAAWDFVTELPANEKFELAVVNPNFVVGPILHGATGMSFEVIKSIFTREMPMLPHFSIGICDVRDVALAHLKCMTFPEAAGNRHIITHSALWMIDIAKILTAEFASYNPPSVTVPNWVIWIVSWFNHSMALRYKSLTRPLVYDNSRMKTVLQIDPIPPEKSLIDMFYSMIEGGYVPKTDKYKGPPPA
ncbi:hypothetical protein RRG08_040432 [Elysia crispata]|uniref:NAD-dependent epimerase/dehydratase domain-containing protein n=1 Tax=Elysia crispata TaxID=231223 RepID=A0AAE0ZCT5_9GAST|nr:hypothetical protein RRG08_040432 [Elysia crispata]